MARGWPAAAMAAMAIAASACSRANQVHSQAALVTETAPLVLRRGIWAAPEADCVFDPAGSFKTWPDCAHGVRNGGDVFNASSVIHGLVQESRLAPGDPMIRETRWTKQRLYDFEAVRPLRRDARGRVIAYETWVVMCGPQEPPAIAPSPGDDTPAAATPAAASPLPPGLESREDGSGCLARGLGAVRAAAVETRVRAWDEPRRHHYVRPFRFRDNFGHPTRPRTEPPVEPPGVAPEPQSG